MWIILERHCSFQYFLFFWLKIPTHNRNQLCITWSNLCIRIRVYLVKATLLHFGQVMAGLQTFVFNSLAGYRRQNCWARLWFCPNVQNMDTHTGHWWIRYITDIMWQKWSPFPVYNSTVSCITPESVAAWQNLQWPFTSLRGGSPP